MFSSAASIALLLLIAALLLPKILGLHRTFTRNVAAVRRLPGIRVLLHPHSIFAWLPRLPFVNIGDQYIWRYKYDLFCGGSDIISLVAAFPWARALLVADPIAVQAIVNDRKTFQKPVHYYRALSLFGMNVGVAEGETWKRHRRIVVTSFAERTHALVWDEAVKTISACTSQWQREAVDGQVRVKSGVELTLKIGLFVLAATTFSYRPPWSDEADAALPTGHHLPFRLALTGVLEGAIIQTTLPKFIRNLPIAHLRHTKECYREYEQYVDEFITERYAGATDASESPNDLLQALIEAEDTEGGEKSKGLSREEVIGNIYIFLLAGHETIAHTLAFALTLLAIHPEIQDELQKLIDQVFAAGGSEAPFDAFSKLDLVRATFLEAQRLFPPVIVIPKFSTASASLPTSEGSQIYVPRWTDVFLNAVALHRNPKYWGDDCNEFRPSRFSDAADGSYKWPRNAYLAFSAGHRACMGRHFATVEAVAVLSQVLKDYTVRLPEDLLHAKSQGETNAERMERILRPRSHITLTPQHQPLIFARRNKEQV